jgi:Rad52/22 family double-strand break repair protein
MGFSSKQVAALRRNVDQRHIRIRQSNGRELSYLEGWYVIAQANRIFGFDGWSRETLESKCVLSRENRGYFTAVYTAKVRLTVQANGISIIREGHGAGEGRGEFPGEVHDTALKSAETDATKRALITFGRPFGLELYRGGEPARQGRAAEQIRPRPPVPSAAPPMRSAAANGAQAAAARAAEAEASAHRGGPSMSAVQESLEAPLPVQAAPELAPVERFARDDTTPIPRPSTYYGREHYHDIREENAALMRQAPRHAAGRPSASGVEQAEAIDADEKTLAAAKAGSRIEQPAAHLSRHVAAEAPSLLPGETPAERIDKSVLPLAEPKRIRDKEHLKFVARQPCVVCGRQPSDAHHLRFAQPRALGMKVSDEFTVPLCRTHHRYLHQTGNELAWWEKARIEPLPIARKLWEASHPRAASQSATPLAVAEAQTVALDETKPIAAVQS